MQRILKLDGVVDVIVEIDIPVVDIETDNHYVCNYRITGLSKELSGFSMGVDAIQAIDIAIQLIGNRLHQRSEFKNGRLFWPFSHVERNLGFGDCHFEDK